MRKILSVWSTLRSRSTAFLWMVKNRGDFTVVHEPFWKSAYYSEERIFYSRSDVQPQPQYNYDVVLNRLVSMGEKENVFVKDFPFAFLHKVDDRFLALFQHTFLIRNPAQMLPSYFYKYPELTIEEVGVQQLYQFFEKVVDFTGVVPPIVEADDLVKHPKSTVEAYCQSVGIPFIPEALSWEPPKENVKEISWSYKGNWHESLSRSSGFHEPRTDRYLNIDESDRLKYLYDLSLPYYEKLYAHRLRIV